MAKDKILKEVHNEIYIVKYSEVIYNKTTSDGFKKTNEYILHAFYDYNEAVEYIQLSKDILSVPLMNEYKVLFDTEALESDNENELKKYCIKFVGRNEDNKSNTRMMCFSIIKTKIK